ncbi:MAG: putative metal dependent hydrolase [Candidatus Ozemobacter sibiricus]|uniref:Putative metal dependent hydrolase n=1 Tax=Candidatus Ozemobacter sibiricus TaxID=2268124 RepID=A0A367ZLC3_9BACT|nr:MAG: putative metal dependent hydrolase [Candidatus Ozemobacter sibiricus]
MRTFIDSHVTWLGHDGFRLTGAKTIYIDPFQIAGGPVADIICVTHEHFDHCSPDDLKKIQGPHTVVVGPADALAKVSGRTQVVKPGDRLTVEGIPIEVVPAYNTDKKFHPKGNGWVGYIITLDGHRIYHAGDTDHIPEMKQIKADIALLPVSGTYVMTAEQAVAAALEIKPAVAIPMHFGAIVGQKSDAEKFRDALAGKVEVVILSPHPG